MGVCRHLKIQFVGTNSCWFLFVDPRVLIGRQKCMVFCYMYVYINLNLWFVNQHCWLHKMFVVKTLDLFQDLISTTQISPLTVK